MGATMENLVASVDHLVFDTEMALDTQLGAQLLPFHGMDKTGMAVCVYFTNSPVTNRCEKGSLCPYRHIIGDKSVVCKHWLRGLCKKGDMCEFLHEYDLSKMPECYFFSKYNACSNKECPFRHIDPESRIKDCPWYDRGFCRHGPHCKSRHRRRVLCVSYMNGLCVEGALCKHTHPSFDIPPPPDMTAINNRMAHILCHNCHERGHKASNCPNLPSDQNTAPQNGAMYGGGGQRGRGGGPMRRGFGGHMMGAQRQNMTDVTCFKCGERGHFANRCSKGAMAFLSAAAQQPTQQLRTAGEMQR